MISCTSRHPIEDSANRNNFAVLPLFSRPRNAQQPDCSVLPKSSWHARLKEHKGDPGGITGYPVLKFGTGGQVVPLGFDLWPREKCPKEFNFSPKVTL